MNTFTMLMILGLATANALSLPSLTDDCETSMPTGDTCPSTVDDIAWLFPEPEHCSRYYECVNGCYRELVCQDGKLYDEVYEACLPAEHVRKTFKPT